MGIIKQAGILIDKAVQQLKRYQSGEDTPIKTGFPHLDANTLGGIFKQMIITIAGASGSGKSYVLQQIENAMFNKNLNPNCDKYILLRCNYEMSVFKLLLRKMKQKLRTTMRTILFEVPSEEEQLLHDEVIETERNPNIFYLEEPQDPKSWYETVKEFLSGHRDKEQVVISIDHIALIKDIGGVKKKAMDDLIEYINVLKKEFDNSSFIILSQLNRDIESRIDVRHLAPKRSDLYNSDTIYQISDLVLVINNPYKLGHDKYMVVNPDKYFYLAEYLDKPNNKRTNFKTKNAIFWHYLKIRDIEEMDDIRDIYVEELGIPNLKAKLDKEKPKASVKVEESDGIPFLSSQSDVHNKLPDDFLEANEEDNVPF